MGYIIWGAAFGLILARIWLAYDLSGTTKAQVKSRDSDDELAQAFTRGQLHHLSMDAGMGTCWNGTVKKLFYLACPTVMSTNPNLEVELAFILTSCFCISIGYPRLTCRPSSARSMEKYYHVSLIECAVNKCYNKYELDAFKINHHRIQDLCHYLLDEAQRPEDEKEPISYIDDGELETLHEVVSGECFEQYDTRLGVLADIVASEIKGREQGMLFWIRGKIEHFSLIMDDVKLKLRLGKYSEIPYYY